jgi:translation initiation factor 2 beta subunit (eIF-2beta)/eIF-5
MHDCMMRHIFIRAIKVETMEIGIEFSGEELKLIKKLLKSKKDPRPIKEILEKKFRDYKIGLVFSAHFKLSEICPKCGSIETTQDMDWNSIEDSHGKIIIFLKCINCNNKFSIIWNPFETDPPSW